MKLSPNSARNSLIFESDVNRINSLRRYSMYSTNPLRNLSEGITVLHGSHLDSTLEKLNGSPTRSS